MKRDFREITKLEVNPNQSLQFAMVKGKPVIDMMMNNEVPVGQLRVSYRDGTKEIWEI